MTDLFIAESEDIKSASELEKQSTAKTNSEGEKK